ncbi:MAG: class I SAM-dependent methyltransferase [Chlamydiota bacterium]
MDVQTTEEIQLNSHYEYIVTSEQRSLNGDYREEALRSLQETQGWCTTLKASVLMDFVHTLKAQRVVEIGVFGGSSLIPIAYALKERGEGIIYGIDPWLTEASVEGMEGLHELWWATIDHEAILQGLLQKISDYKLDTYIELLRTTSEEAPNIEGIDILHVDGNHSDRTSFFDVTKWVPLVRKGGIIIFDDMTWGTTDRAVKWLDEHCDKLGEFHEENVWGLWVKP